MAFTTHDWRKRKPDRPSVWTFVLACVLVSLIGLPAVRASVLADDFRIDRSEDVIEAHARLKLRLPDSVEAALTKGVPLYFVWQADVIKERWYWRDKRVSTRYRTWRLAYQPLTQRWRLSLSNQAPGDGQQFLLHQNVENLQAAVAAIGRLSAWALAPAAQVAVDDDHQVDLSFRLDTALLPRPFQIGVGGSQDWNLRWQTRTPVPRVITTPPVEGEPLVGEPEVQR